jgi:hypothetical protein
MEDLFISDKNNRNFTHQPIYVYGILPVTYRSRGVGGSNLPPQKSEILTKMTRIPTFMENTFLTT